MLKKQQNKKLRADAKKDSEIEVFFNDSSNKWRLLSNSRRNRYQKGFFDICGRIFLQFIFISMLGKSDEPDLPPEAQGLAAAAAGLYKACFDLEGTTFDEWVTTVRLQREKFRESGKADGVDAPSTLPRRGNNIEHLSASERQVSFIFL